MSVGLVVSKNFTLRAKKSTLDSNRTSCAKLFMFLIFHSKVEGRGLLSSD